MSVEEHDILLFSFALEELVKTSLRATPDEIAFGPPCDHLVERAMRGGSLALAKRLVECQSEFRLNGAGLKLYVSVDQGKIRARVGGDQFDQYPATGPVLNGILAEKGFQEPLE